MRLAFGVPLPRPTVNRTPASVRVGGFYSIIPTRGETQQPGPGIVAVLLIAPSHLHLMPSQTAAVGNKLLACFLPSF